MFQAFWLRVRTLFEVGRGKSEVGNTLHGNYGSKTNLPQPFAYSNKNAMKINRSFVVFLTVSLVLPSLYGQRLDTEAIQNQFPGEDAVILNQQEHLHITQNDAGQLEIRLDSKKETLILNAGNIAFSNDAIFYTSFSDIQNIQAETKVPVSRNKYRSVPVTDIEEQEVLENGIFYSDYKRKMIIFPAVENGAILDLSYEEYLSDPHMLSPFYFDSYAPVLEAAYSVTFPNTVELATVLYGRNTEQVRFEESVQGNYTTYTWRAENMPRATGEENAPSRAYYSPHVIIRISQYQKKGETIPVLRDKADLYNWYEGLVKQMPEEDETELKSLVRELTASLNRDIDKAEAIFNWVQNNIQYIAFEDGMGGFVPRPASSVCTRRYGDCKDMANLLARMLNYAGLEAYLTWIGTRSKPYTYGEVPTPIVDNHMITTLKIDGETYLLDATGKYTPFPLPTPMIQGKEAMIGLGDGRFEIRKVPAIEKEVNLLTDSTWLSIQDRDLIGKARRQARGFFQLDLDAKRNLIEENGVEQFWQDYLTKGNNKFALTDFSPQTVRSDRAAGLSIPYDFELPGYVRKVGSRMLINLNLNRRLQSAGIDLSKRKYDREFEFRYIHRDVNTLDIPEGYSVSYLPKSVEYQDDRFGFQIRYNQTGGRIILEKEIYINTLLLTEDDFSAWNEMIDQLVHAYREVVVLSE